MLANNPAVKKRGRPRKNTQTAPAAKASTKSCQPVKKRQNMTFHRELLSLKQVTKSRTRSFSQSKGKESINKDDGVAGDEGEARFMLTFKALPPCLRVIAQLLHPAPQAPQEEHRLVCRLMSENNSEMQIKQNEIAIPTFKRLPSLRTGKESEKQTEEKVVTTQFARYFFMALGNYH
jgi:hypothetical protein